MSEDQRSILKRRVVDHQFEGDDPRRFDHYYAIALSAVFILIAEAVQKGWFG